MRLHRNSIENPQDPPGCSGAANRGCRNALSTCQMPAGAGTNPYPAPTLGDCDGYGDCDPAAGHLHAYGQRDSAGPC